MNCINAIAIVKIQAKRNADKPPDEAWCMCNCATVFTIIWS